jgi:organic radical activating enzyme
MGPIKRIEPAPGHPNYFMVDWMLHDRCTYDCSYCPPANKAGSETQLELGRLEQFRESVTAHAHRHDPDVKMMAGFSGGEPTIWRGFEALVDSLNDHGWHLIVTSNGSRTDTWWDRMAPKFKWICLSYHTEHADPDKFINVVRAASRHTVVSVHIMLNPDPLYFEQALAFGQRLADSVTDCKIRYKPIQHYFGLQKINVAPYTPQQLAQIAGLKTRKGRELASQHDDTRQLTSDREGLFKYLWPLKHTVLDSTGLINQGLNRFLNWECRAGLDGIFVDARGDVMKATCRVDGKIGTIQDPQHIQWPTHAVTCPLVTCNCATDVRLGKTSPTDPQKVKRIIPITYEPSLWTNPPQRA